MARYQVREIARRGERLEDASGIAEPMASEVNAYWLTRPNALILSVFPAPAGGLGWEGLGKELLALFLPGRTQVGFMADGIVGRWGIPEALAMDAARRLWEGTDSGLGELRSWRLAEGGEGPSMNFTLSEIRDAAEMTWLRTVWDDIDASAFIHDADVMIVGYDTSVSHTIRWPFSPGLGWFGESLLDARSWMGAIENLGFSVGVFAGTDEHRALVAGAASLAGGGGGDTVRATDD